MKRIAYAAMLAASLNACHREPKAKPSVPPDWRAFAIDGITPMMTPDQVGHALAFHGYRPSDCGVEGPIDPDALRTSADSFCYDDLARGWRASLYFLQTREGRRLAVIKFTDIDPFSVSEVPLRARNTVFLDKLLARFGRRHLAFGKPPVILHVWKVPGGSETLPDHIQTVDMPHEGRNVEMTSFWAYQHQISPSSTGNSNPGTTP